MKLHSLTVEGFRGFTDSTQIDLSADVIIVVGPNGTGKTSMLDAILWALTGTLKRIGENQDRIISLYAPAGLARVSLRLSERDTTINIIRTRLEGKTDLRLVINEREYDSELAQAELIRTLWEPGLSSDTPSDALHAALTHSVYLQQDLVRDFIDHDDNAAKFEAISELVGVGRVSDFQRRMESSRNAWARVMHQRESAVNELRNRVSAIIYDLSRLTSESAESDFPLRWVNWWARLSNQDLEPQPTVGYTTTGAATVLEQMLKTLQAARGAVQRKLSLVPQIRDDLRQLSEATIIPDSEIADLRDKVGAYEKVLADLSGGIRTSQIADLDAQTKLLEKKNSADEMRALAVLALRHLSEHCPVCDQEIVQQEIRQRLEVIVERQGDNLAENPYSSKTQELQRALALTQRSLNEVSMLLQERVNRANAFSAKKSLLYSQLADLELSMDTDQANLDTFERSLKKKLDDFQTAYKEGEDLSLAIARFSEHGKRDELVRQKDEAERVLHDAEATYASYKSVHEVASGIIESLRSLADDAVSLQIEKISPLLDKIYTRIDPHPTFRSATLKSYISYGKGRVETPVFDSRGGHTIDVPAEIFSSGQANALAVSIFLAMNLAVDQLPLQAAILDDPLQSLDDINLLGLVDVLRRTRKRRQLLISTHDERFAGLLERKFRPVMEGERTSRIVLENWERGGTKIKQYTTADVATRLQVVSA